MKEKTLESIGNSKFIEKYPSIAYNFFSIYLCRKVYFRCRIILVNDEQEEELIKIYESVILKKMGFGENF